VATTLTWQLRSSSIRQNGLPYSNPVTVTVVKHTIEVIVLVLMPEKAMALSPQVLT